MAGRGRPRRSSGSARGSRAPASPARRSRARTAAARGRSRMPRAATAGNSASRSFVAVKMQLTNFSGASALRRSSRCISSSSRRGSPRRRCARRSSRPAGRTAAWRRFCRARGAAAAELAARRAGAGARPCAQLAEPSGPKRTRASAITGCPTAAHMRRTWRLRPSWIVSSISCAPSRRARAGAVESVVELTPSRSRRSARVAERPPPSARGRSWGPRARMRQAVGQLAVVGQQDQAGAVGVQAPDRIQARAGAGDQATTVGRPCVSRAVETTPTGLCSA